MKFEDRNANFWKWGLELALVCFIVLVGWSIYHLSPSLFPIALAICIAEFLASIVYTIFTTDIRKKIRYVAWICVSMIAVSLAFNAIIHGALSRQHDVAKQNKAAKAAEEERKLRLKQIETEINRKQNESDALIEEQKRKTIEAQNRQLALVNRSQRQITFQPKPAPSNTVNSLDESLYEAKIVEKKPEILSPEEVQENAFTWVLLGIIASVSAVIGTAIAFIRTLIKQKSSQTITASLPYGIDRLISLNPESNNSSRVLSPKTISDFDQNMPSLSESNSSRVLSPKLIYDFEKVGEWEMPTPKNCKWKENTGQRSLELYAIIGSKEIYLGRFGISAQEVWKSLSDTERVNLILAQVQAWMTSKGV